AGPPMSFFLDSRPVRSGLLVAAAWWLAAGATSAAPPSPTAAASLDEDHAEKMARGLEIFKQQARPVLVERCLRCHGGKKTEAEFDLSDRDRLLRGGSAGPAILAGNANDSLLYKLITQAREPHMPHE